MYDTNTDNKENPNIEKIRNGGEYPKCAENNKKIIIPKPNKKLVQNNKLNDTKLSYAEHVKPASRKPIISQLKLSIIPRELFRLSRVKMS